MMESQGMYLRRSLCEHILHIYTIEGGTCAVLSISDSNFDGKKHVTLQESRAVD